jgi:hypothetical protein
MLSRRKLSGDTGDPLRGVSTGVFVKYPLIPANFFKRNEKNYYFENLAGFASDSDNFHWDIIAGPQGIPPPLVKIKTKNSAKN